jgi:hypothetical protein
MRAGAAARQRHTLVRAPRAIACNARNDDERTVALLTQTTSNMQARTHGAGVVGGCDLHGKVRVGFKLHLIPEHAESNRCSHE